MPDFASDVSIKSGSLTLDGTDDDEISGYYKHTMKLHPNRLYAEELLNKELISAKEYNGQEVAVYLLVKYEKKYYTLLHYEGKKEVQIPSSEEILELISCNPDTQPAIVDHLNIEELSDKCLEIWCRKNDIDENEVLRECTLYLKPIEKENSIQNLFTEKISRNSKREDNSFQTL